MKIKPILDRILIREIEQKRSSNILLPDTIDKPKQGIGEVIDIGGGKVGKRGKEPITDIKIGDTIIFKRSLPLIITDDDRGEFLMIYYEDILGLVNMCSKRSK